MEGELDGETEGRRGFQAEPHRGLPLGRVMVQPTLRTGTIPSAERGRRVRENAGLSSASKTLRAKSHHVQSRASSAGE
jgi:hypothetical protein